MGSGQAAQGGGLLCGLNCAPQRDRLPSQPQVPVTVTSSRKLMFADEQGRGGCWDGVALTTKCYRREQTRTRREQTPVMTDAQKGLMWPQPRAPRDRWQPRELHRPGADLLGTSRGHLGF